MILYHNNNYNKFNNNKKFKHNKINLTKSILLHLIFNNNHNYNKYYNRSKFYKIHNNLLVHFKNKSSI
jgi:hypothetical protein